MSEPYSPARATDSLQARRARKRSEASWAPRAAVPAAERCGPAAAGTSSAPALDACMRDLVERFEDTYAALASGTREALERHEPPGDLFPEFPDIFDELSDHGTAASARASMSAESEALWRADTLPATRRERRPEVEDDIDLDEAFSILNAPQVERAQAQDRLSRESQRLARERPESIAPQHLNAAEAPTADAAEMERPQGRAAPTEWSTRSHRPHSIAIAAAVLALVAGISIGYVAGHTPGASKSVTVTVGGAGAKSAAKLRLDYDLRQP